MGKIDYPSTRLLIGADWCDAASGETIDVTNPATDEVIGTVAKAGRPDLDRALDAAAKGFETWSRVGVFDRYKTMRKAAELLRSRADAIGTMMTLEQGKPLAQAKLEVLGGADTIDWFAEEARRSYGQTIPARMPGVMQITVKVPVGPVAAFTPWNFPINQVVRKLSAALATGCSIIVKAPEETPASPAELIRAFVDAGVPEGVIGLVYGVPSEVSEYLIPHPVIRKITFTGSTPVGKHLAALAGRHMKRATMELGGHAPVLVFGDADIDTAVATMAASKIRNAGQVCVSPTRFLVQDGAFDQFREGFVRAMQDVKVGDGMDADSQMGPLANERRIPAMQELIADAIKLGAKLECGGERIGNTGNFFQPTVLSDVPTEARVMNEEPFGPLAVINRFKGYDDGISEANRLPYGLAAYAWTGSAETAQKLPFAVRSGMLTVNHIGLALPEVPFGGVGDSGYGTEGGSEATEAYLETRFATMKA